jgi:hypothetical protein
LRNGHILGDDLLDDLFDGVGNWSVDESLDGHGHGNWDSDFNGPWDVDNLFHNLFHWVGDLAFNNSLHWVGDGLVNNLLDWDRHFDTLSDFIGDLNGVGDVDSLLNWDGDGVGLCDFVGSCDGDGGLHGHNLAQRVNCCTDGGDSLGDVCGGRGSWDDV